MIYKIKIYLLVPLQVSHAILSHFRRASDKKFKTTRPTLVTFHLLLTSSEVFFFFFYSVSDDIIHRVYRRVGTLAGHIACVIGNHLSSLDFILLPLFAQSSTSTQDMVLPSLIEALQFNGPDMPHGVSP